jgi:hypothetical protein
LVLVKNEQDMPRQIFTDVLWAKLKAILLKMGIYNKPNLRLTIEGISTRLLVYAGQLNAKGVDAEAACSMTMITPLTDDPDMRDTLHAAVQTFLG